MYTDDLSNTTKTKTIVITNITTIKGLSSSLDLSHGYLDRVGILDVTTTNTDRLSITVSSVM